MQTDAIFEQLEKILEGFAKLGVPTFVADCKDPNITWKFLLDQINNQILILHGEAMRFQDNVPMQAASLSINLTPEERDEYVRNTEASKYVSNPHQIIDIINIKDTYIDIQKDVRGHFEELLFIEQETGNLIFRYKYTKTNSKIIENHIWQSVKYKGFAQRIYLSYILKSFNCIITDKSITEHGNNFLFKIYQILILDNHYQLGVGNLKTNQIIKTFQHPEQIKTEWKTYFNNTINPDMDDIRLFIKKV